MNIKYQVFKANIITEITYLLYRIKSILGIKTYGFKKYDSLITIKLLKKYELPIYSMHVIALKKDLNAIDINPIHDDSLRIHKDDYLSIILNHWDKQIKIVVGNNLTVFISDPLKQKIEKEIQAKIHHNEIIAGLEKAMQKIYQYISKNKDV